MIALKGSPAYATMLEQELLELWSRIQNVEWAASHCGHTACPWCGNGPAEDHSDRCEMFTPEGDIK